MAKDVAKEILNYLNFNDGFFIECGANDGIFQSNTLILEKEKNWSGLLIEPSLTAFEQLLINRNNEKNILINCALVSFNYNKNTIIGDFDGHPMSSVNGKRRNSPYSMNIEVPVFTLTGILKTFNIEKIDFFSLDVEGYELEILKGLDFDKYNPHYILLEVNIGEEEIFNYLENKNYENLGCLSEFNKIDDPNWDGSHNDWLFEYKFKDYIK